MNPFIRKEADSDFEKAKRRGKMQTLMNELTWKNTNLLSLYDVTALVKPKSETYRGMQTIPVSKIIGSEGRYHDFSTAFYPKREMLRQRWRSIDMAHLESVTLPPISAFKLGDAYFVRDGNHRVSVAKAMGVEFIDAEVVELDAVIPLKPGMTMKQLNQKVCQWERSQFIEQYHPTYLPMDRIVSNSAGFYPELVNHILVHKYYINQPSKKEISFEEAAKSWYKNVYSPIVDEIRRQRILTSFPGMTEADLYMWIVRYWDEKKKKKGEEFSISRAAHDYKKENGKGFFSRLAARIKYLIHAFFPNP